MLILLNNNIIYLEEVNVITIIEGNNIELTGDLINLIFNRFGDLAYLLQVLELVLC